MSIWDRQQTKETNYKPSCSDLLFEKILRCYKAQQKVPKLSDMKHNNQSNTNKVKRSSSISQTTKNEPKQMIDLNKKMKLIKLRPNNDENKQNESLNSHFNCASSVNTLSQKLTSLKRDMDEEGMLKNLQVNQFALFAVQNNKSSQSHQQNNQSAYPQQKLQQNEQKMKGQQKEQAEPQGLDQEQYPEIPMPLKQLSQYQFLDQKKILPFEEIIHENQLENAHGQSQVQLQQQSQSKAYFKKKAENVHIKNKISLRILKKKLQTLSPEEVVADLIQHRRIEFEGFFNQPEKETICEALLSFMKKQLIQ